MPVSQLLEMAQNGKYSEFETRCLELLEQGELRLSQLTAAFDELEKKGEGERLATLTQMICENIELPARAKEALPLACRALVQTPKDAAVQKLVADLYRHSHGDTPGFDAIMDSSGLLGGRPPRMALKLLDIGLTLEEGDTLISRADDHVVEVVGVDRTHGLFRLRRAGRVTTRPTLEVVREYDRIASDDFRVLRQLRPESLKELIHDDPVKVVVGLIHAHGEHIDADVLKHDLVPRHIDPKDWSSWWTKARTRLKRNPHVVIEGRSPMILTYHAEGMTLEEETWEAIEAARDIGQWISTLEGYLREVKARREKPDASLLQRFYDHLVRYIHAIRNVRPSEALACALAIGRLEEKGVPATDESRALPVEMLRTAAAPGKMLMSLEQDNLRDRALAALKTARPDDWADYVVEWLEVAPANLLDALSADALEAGRGDAVQALIDRGLNEPAEHPELLFWLWKGPKHAKSFDRPSDDELFRMILDTISTLGRSVAAEDVIVRTFRMRMRAALALRSYAKARACLERLSEEAAITVKHQLQRLEGMGDNTPAKLLDALRDTHPVLWVVKQKRIEPWEDPETLWCTQAGMERRVAERDELLNVKMRENAKRIGEAASHGDLSENSEYKFALEERDFLRAQLAKLNDELSRAAVIEPLEIPEDHVGIGTQVVLRTTADGAERTMTFLGPFETDVEQGVYSYMAPMSQRIMGLHTGDRVTVPLDGHDLELEIVSIRNALVGAATT